MLAWALSIARASTCFDEIMVSTEDEAIAAEARRWGGQVPFMRSPTAASDHATTVDVLQEVLQAYAVLGRTFELACCLYPTAVLVAPETLARGGHMLERDAGLDTVVSVMAYPHPIQRALVVEKGRLRWHQPENAGRRTQDLTEFVHDAGQFYWFRPARFQVSPVLLGPACAPLKLKRTEAVDIDTEEDWAWAERMFSIYLGSLHKEEPL